MTVQASCNFAFFMPRYIGDAINTLPGIALIKSYYPESTCYIICQPYLIPLFSHEGFECIPDTRKKNSFLGTLKLITALRKYKISHCVYFSNKFIDALIGFMGGASYRSGYSTEGRRFLLTHHTHFVRHRHDINRYAMVCNLLCDNSYKKLPAVKLNNFEKSPLDIHPKKVVIYFGSEMKDKRFYPINQSVDTLNKIHQKYPTASFHFIGQDIENGDIESIITQLPTSCSTQNHAGKTNLIELCALIASSQLVITIDSGPMHLACALDRPTIALDSFGSGPFSSVEPKSPLCRIVKSRRSFLNDEDQVLDLLTDDIVKASEEFLA